MKISLKKFRLSSAAVLMGFALSVMALSGCEKPAESTAAVPAAKTLVEVWKTPTCGCCGAWVDHLKENGFEVKVNEVADTAIYRAALKIPQDYGSCHSAKVEGYALEGHVPASDIRKLLAEKPAGVGLSVPGMPLGSPGMEHPDHPTMQHAYDVLLIGDNGSATSYTHYEEKQ